MNVPDDFRLAICSLLAEGKKPSVAHLKAKLGNRTPLPIIINLLQQYQAAPERYSAADANSDGPTEEQLITSSETAVESSESQPHTLSDIHSELVQIRQLLEKLVSS